jgi:acetylglutamate kinase
VDQASRIQHAEILLEALPYIRRFTGKTVVVKYGGSAMVDDDLKNAFARDIVLLKYVGMLPVVVHGGGPQINKMLASLAIPSSFVRGRRVTDAETMRVVEMILAGEINGEVVTRIDLAGGRAAGLSGKDGGLIRARRLGDELGQVGEVIGVDAEVILALQTRGFIPVVAPLGAGPDGESLNINADTMAGKVAEALRAEKLLLLTDVRGILDREGNLLSSLSVSEARGLIEQGVIEGGMIPKVECCLEALRGGVSKVHIIDGRVRHAPLLELFTDEGVGTEVHRDGASPRSTSAEGSDSE